MPPAGKKKDDTPKPTTAVVIAPPTRHRVRTSTVPAALVDDMLEKIKTGWVSDNQDYPSKKDASNASVVHRRALIRALGGDPNDAEDSTRKRVASQVWETEKDGKPSGRYVFALALDIKKDKTG